MKKSCFREKKMYERRKVVPTAADGFIFSDSMRGTKKNSETVFM